jgi:hypothetical protein
MRVDDMKFVLFMGVAIIIGIFIGLIMPQIHGLLPPQHQVGNQEYCNRFAHELTFLNYGGSITDIAANRTDEGYASMICDCKTNSSRTVFYEDVDSMSTHRIITNETVTCTAMG